MHRNIFTARDDTRDLSHLSSTYIGLHLAGGHVGLPILILTFFVFKKVQRPATVINFCAAWVIYSVSYCLLIYGGHHLISGPPPFTLCLVQASMIHGASPMAAVAGLGVVLQAWSAFSWPGQQQCCFSFLKLPSWALVTAIITPPYLAFAAFALVAAYIGRGRPELVVSHNSLYCTLDVDGDPFQRFAVPMFCAALLTIIAMMEVGMIVQYYRGCLVIRNICPLATWRPSLSPWFRVTLFTLYTVATLGTCITYVTDSSVSALPHMIQAALPLTATLIFATQMDILVAWRIVRPKPADHNDTDYAPGGGWASPSATSCSSCPGEHLAFPSPV